MLSIHQYNKPFVIVMSVTIVYTKFNNLNKLGWEKRRIKWKIKVKILFKEI